jgi:hypothetical protein
MKTFSLLLALVLPLLLAPLTSAWKGSSDGPEAAPVGDSGRATEKGSEQAATTKYGHLIVKDDQLIRKGHFVDSIYSSYDNLKMDFTMNYHCMTEPIFMVKTPHAHGSYEILGFIGGNPLDIRDFGGEVELSLGEEGEKHIINSSSFVVIPPGLPHGPLNFKKVDRPFMFLVILMAGIHSTLPKEEGDAEAGSAARSLRQFGFRYPEGIVHSAISNQR